jgi:hypothetical protein
MSSTSYLPPNHPAVLSLPDFSQLAEKIANHCAPRSAFCIIFLVECQSKTLLKIARFFYDQRQFTP